MLRTSLDKAHIKRTIRPLYGWTQSTPKSCYLDPAWDRSVKIWPGMAMMRTTGENYSLVGAGANPSGLCGLYIGGDEIDEIREQGINALAVWVLATDAEFEILAPAFDTGASWVDNTPGTDVLVHAYTDGANRGKLAPAGTVGRGTLSGAPVARLVKVVSASKIIVAGLRGTV